MSSFFIFSSAILIFSENPIPFKPMSGLAIRMQPRGMQPCDISLNETNFHSLYSGFQKATFYYIVQPLIPPPPPPPHTHTHTPLGNDLIKLIRRFLIWAASSEIVHSNMRNTHKSRSSAFRLLLSIHTVYSIHITKTYLHNFDSLKPNFYIVKLGFTEVYIILFLLKNIDCGHSLEPPRRGSSNEYPQSVLSRNMKNIRIFI